MQALKIAATGMAAQQMRVDVTAQNIANMSTTGYNARRAEFADLHYQQIRTPGAVTAGTGEILPAGVQLGLGVRPAAVSMEVRQGSMRQTGGELDIGIEGDGYIEIELPSGEIAYTRDGSLKLTGEGELVTSEGYRVLPGITIPADARKIEINRVGGVFALFEGQVEVQQLGSLQLATFINDKGLEAIGDNLFRETAASGAPNVGEAGGGRARHVPAGLSGTELGRRGHRDHRTDRGAARLRVELQGVERRRRDAVDNLADTLMRYFLILVALVGLSMPASAADVLARRTLRVGTIISATDLDGEGQDSATVIAWMQGLEVRRAIYAGHPVSRDDLGPPTLVRRNEIVVMTFRAGALGLRTEGRALGAGGAGEIVEVMNLSSRQTVRAIVTNRRAVEVRR